MRHTHLVEILVLTAVAVPNVLFTLGCVLPGCGTRERPPAPDRAVVDADPPEEDTPTGATGDTAAESGPTDTGAPRVCDDGAAALDLVGVGGEALGDEVSLTYGGKVEACQLGRDGRFRVGVAPTGLLSGPVEVSWTLAVDGRPRAGASGATTWDLGCATEGGLEHGLLSIGLPAAADGASVTLEVSVTDAAGTQVDASHRFVATVTESAEGSPAGRPWRPWPFNSDPSRRWTSNGIDRPASTAGGPMFFLLFDAARAVEPEEPPPGEHLTLVGAVEARGFGDLTLRDAPFVHDAGVPALGGLYYVRSDQRGWLDPTQYATWAGEDRRALQIGRSKRALGLSVGSMLPLTVGCLASIVSKAGLSPALCSAYVASDLATVYFAGRYVRLSRFPLADVRRRLAPAPDVDTRLTTSLRPLVR